MILSTSAAAQILKHGAFALALALAFVPGAQAQSQAGKGTANALEGFGQNRNQPIEIEAERLEVRDKQKIATFTGSVKVVQGDTIMRCKTLVVFYEGDAAPGSGPKTATPGPGGSQQIKKIEARGEVVVIKKDQTATSEMALFDTRSNSVTLTGNAVVSQGKNVVRGERIVVDLTTNVTRVDAGSSNGPVRMLIQQQPKDQQSPGSAPSLSFSRALSN